MTGTTCDKIIVVEVECRDTCTCECVGGGEQWPSVELQIVLILFEIHPLFGNRFNFRWNFNPSTLTKIRGWCRKQGEVNHHTADETDRKRHE